MSDDILDLFAGKYKSSTNSSNKSTGNTTSSLQNSSKTKKPEPVPNAPIELMSQFLMLITENKMREALLIAKEILTYEPDNRIVLEYQSTLKQYIDQGYADVQPVVEEEEDDEDEEEDDDDSDKENDDSADEESKSEHKR